MIGSWTRTALVALFYIALWDRITPGIVISGVLVALVLQSPFRRRTYQISASGTIRTVGRLTWEVLLSNISVIGKVLGIGTIHPKGILEVELRRAKPGVDVLVGLMVTLTPGTMTMGIDRRDDGSALLTVHALSMPTAQAVRDAVHRLEGAAVAAVRVADPTMVEGAE
ncbi:Na+/H+ antiporter subunit E [Euzebya tangerina]|uniref:Na+/H+ antiporter subunit E n=1 Tax=Euzebya tangerina TaxID=591198 RepID=UPI000E322850|nr:Na+/H+ antiporter subunit E [Euzebya tangerina]